MPDAEKRNAELADVLSALKTRFKEICEDVNSGGASDPKEMACIERVKNKIDNLENIYQTSTSQTSKSSDNWTSEPEADEGLTSEVQIPQSDGVAGQYAFTTDQEAEDAFNDRVSEYEELTTKLAKLRAWPHPDIEILQEIVDQIKLAVDGFDYTQALVELDQAIYSMKAPYQDYLDKFQASKDFQKKFDQLTVHVEKLWNSKHITPETGNRIGDLQSLLSRAENATASRDFAKGLKILETLEAELKEVKTTLDQATKDYDAYVKRHAEYREQNSAGLSSHNPWIKQIAEELSEDLNDFFHAYQANNFAQADEIETGIKNTLRNLLEHLQEENTNRANANVVLFAAEKLSVWIHASNFATKPVEFAEFMTAEAELKQLLAKVILGQPLVDATKRFEASVEPARTAYERARAVETAKSQVTYARERYLEYSHDYAEIADIQTVMKSELAEMDRKAGAGDWLGAEGHARKVINMALSNQKRLRDASMNWSIAKSDLKKIAEAMAEAFRPERGRTERMAKLETEIKALYEQMQSGDVKTDYLGVIVLAKQAQSKIAEFYEANGDLTIAREIQLNYMIDKIARSHIGIIAGEVLSAATKFQAEAMKSILSTEKDTAAVEFISLVIGPIANVLALIEPVHALVKVAVFGVDGFVGILAQNVDSSKDSKVYVYTLTSNMSDLAEKYRQEYLNGFGVKIMTANRREWDKLAELLIFEGSGAKATGEADVEAQLLKLGLPRSGTGLHDKLVKQSMRSLEKWNMVQKGWHPDAAEMHLSSSER